MKEKLEKLYLGLKEKEEEVKNLEKEIKENCFKDEMVLFNDLRVIAEKSGLDNKGYWERQEEEKNEIKGFVSFLTPILNLKTTAYLEIKYSEDNKIKTIYLSKKGFYEEGYSRKSLIWRGELIKILKFNQDIKEKIKEKATTDEEKEKIEKVFNYFTKSVPDERNILKKEFNNKNISFINTHTRNIIKAELEEIDISATSMYINYIDKETGKRDYECFEIGKKEDINLLLFFAIKNELLQTLQEAKEKIIKGTAEYIEAKKEFYDVISPYLLANIL